MTSTDAPALLSLCREVLSAAGEAEVELAVRVTERGCARFSGGELGQHMELRDPQAVVRVVRGARVAESITTRLDRDALVDAVARTAAAARLVPEVEGFPGFAGAGDPGGSRPPRFCQATAAATAEERVERLAPVLGAVARAGLVSAGMLETRVVRQAVATTRGCEREHESTLAVFKVWALETPGAGGASGSGGGVHVDVGALALAEETERAIATCRDALRPVALDPGTYDVVMEPEAVAELLEWLGAVAFGAPEVEQGTSPFAGRLGERVTGEAVDVSEDPLSDDPDLGFGCPFDREGTWRRRVALIEGGVARSVLYDRTYGARAGAASTGSALLPGPGAEGGVGATSLCLGGGTAAGVDELLAGLDRGLHVRRLHYVNGLVEPRRSVMTGLTRDGCFLVERGRRRRAVRDLRFTESFLEALARSDAMTRARKAVATAWSDDGVLVVPAVRMRGFRFEGDGPARPDM